MEGREVYSGAMREGHVHAWAGRWHEAAAAYRRAVSALPDDAAGRTSLAAALAHTGNPEEALSLFEGLQAERSEDTAVALRVAELRQRLGRMEDADDAYLTVATLYARAGQAEKARGIWQRLMESSGHRADAMRRLVEAATEVGSADVAERARVLAATAADSTVARARADVAARRADEHDPLAEVAAALRERGLVQPSYRPAGAAAVLEPSYAAEDDALAALARDPYDLASARALGLALQARASPVGPRQLADASEVAELCGDLGLAVQLVRDAIPLADDPLPLYRRIVRLALVGEAVEVAADAHLAIARLQLAAGDSRAAGAEAHRARAVAPLSARIHAEAAEQLRRAGDVAAADEAVRRAFQLAPRRCEYALAYVVGAARRAAFDETTIALQAIGDELREDVDAARRAIAQLSRATPIQQWVRGRLRRALGDAGWQADIAAAATASPPVGPPAACYLAQHHFDAGDPRGALDLLGPWLESDDLDEEDRDRIAGLALSAADAAGDHRLAAASLRRLASASPEDETLHALLAERLAAAGQPTSAAAELSRLAERRREAGDLDAAASLIEGALALAPDDGTLLRLAAELALARGDRDGARERYVRSAETLRGESALESLLAAAELSPWGGRVELLRRAVERHPEQVEPRRRLVAALIASGQASRAAAESAELAGLLQLSGDRSGALAALEQARGLDPWNTGLAALHDALKIEGPPE